MRGLFKLNSTQSLIFLLLLSIAVIIGAGYYVYRYQVDLLKEEKLKQLRLFSKQKSQQIENWRENRILDAEIVSKSFRTAAMLGPISSKDGLPNANRLRSYLREFISEDVYEEAIVVNKNKEVLLTVSEKQISLHPIELSLIDLTLEYKKTQFSKVFYTGDNSFIRQSLVIPILATVDTSEMAFMIVLRLNPEKELFPIVQEWPDHTESAEVLLLRRENSDVIFINSPRLEKVKPLTKKLPISETTFVSVKAASGLDTILEGIDYRNVPVVASMTHIGDSNWFLVAKMDESEIYELLRTRALLIWIIIVLLLCVISVTIYFLWRSQKLTYQQKQLELELEKKRISFQYEILSRHANDIIILIGNNGNIIEVNNRALKSYGYSEQEFLNLNLLDLRTVKAGVSLKEIFKNTSEQNGIVYEIEHKKKDGTTFPVEVSMNLIKLEDKNYYQAIIRDITERKKSEEIIQRSERYFRSLIQNSADGIVIIDSTAKILFTSPSIERILGYKESEYQGQNAFKFIHEDDHEKVKIILQKIVDNTRGSSPAQMRMIHEHGHIAWIETVSQNLLKDKFVGGIVVNFRDISNRKKYEEDLAVSEQKYRNLVDNALIGVYRSNIDGKFIYANQALADILEYNDVKELYEINSTQLYKNSSEREIFIDDLRKKQNVLYFETELRSKYGNTKHVLLSGTLEGDVISGMVMDITERRKILDELKREKERAEEASRLKSSFLSTMSHEIRTPLNILLGYADVLGEMYFDNATDEVKNYFRSIKGSGKRLLNTVTQILDISKLESGEFNYEIKKMSLNSEVNWVYDQLKLEAEKKKLILKVNLLDEEICVLADEYCLKGILINLVNNSIKYSKSGTIEISTNRENDNAVCIVKDEGIGMSVEYQKHLFQTFSQEKTGISRPFEGTGLGLAITKKYVELLHGQISVQSKKGIGTEVTVKIPIVK